MKTIWKFELPNPGSNKIKMPCDAMALHVALQDGKPHLWAQVDPDNPVEEREFILYGTGHAMPDDPGFHVGTVLMSGGSLVIHVYDQSDDTEYGL